MDTKLQEEDICRYELGVVNNDALWGICGSGGKETADSGALGIAGEMLRFAGRLPLTSPPGVRRANLLSREEIRRRWGRRAE